MSDKRYLEICLNTFSLNAGIVGLLRILKSNGAVYGPNNEYYYSEDGSILFLSIEYFKSVQWESLFVKKAVDLFGQDTVFNTLLEKITVNQSLTEKYFKLSNSENTQEHKDIQKKLNENYKYITEKLSRNSYLAAYENLKDNKVNCVIADRIKQLKSVKEVQEKSLLLEQIKQQLEVEEIGELLCFKDIIYSKLNRIWDNKAFLLAANAKKDVYVLYHKDFVVPLINSFEQKRAKNTKCCIECGTEMSSSMDLSFMVDSVEDLGRKKSVFWNQKPDAVLCPLCAFIYSLSPLGFNAFGNDLIFLNVNHSVESLYGMNESRKSAKEIVDKGKMSANAKLYQYLNEALDAENHVLFKRLNNIEVIIRSSEKNMYLFSIINKDTLHILKCCSKYFGSLINVMIVPRKDEQINVYQETFYNLMNRRNQYLLMDKLLRISLEDPEERVPYYLKNILKIQMNSRRGVDIVKTSKKIDEMCSDGYKIRKMFSGEEKNENALRGCIYQLLNALKLRDREGFMDVALRLYLANNMEVPEGFIDMLKYDNSFMDLGYAYVLGLKGISKENAKKAVEDNSQNNDEQV